jgi:hypothetical protein
MKTKFSFTSSIIVLFVSVLTSCGNNSSGSNTSFASDAGLNNEKITTLDKTSKSNQNENQDNSTNNTDDKSGDTNIDNCEMSEKNKMFVDKAFDDFKSLKQDPFIRQEITFTNFDGSKKTIDTQEELKNKRLAILDSLIPIVKKNPACAKIILLGFEVILADERNLEPLTIRGINLNRRIDYHRSLGRKLFDMEVLAISLIHKLPIIDFEEQGLVRYEYKAGKKDIMHIEANEIKPFYDGSSPLYYKGEILGLATKEKIKMNALQKLLVFDLKEELGTDGKYYQSFVIRPKSAVPDYIALAKEKVQHQEKNKIDQKNTSISIDYLYKAYVNAEWKDIEITELYIGIDDTIFKGVKLLVNDSVEFKFETNTNKPLKDIISLVFKTIVKGFSPEDVVAYKENQTWKNQSHSIRHLVSGKVFVRAAAERDEH